MTKLLARIVAVLLVPSVTLQPLAHPDVWRSCRMVNSVTFSAIGTVPSPAHRFDYRTEALAVPAAATGQNRLPKVQLVSLFSGFIGIRSNSESVRIYAATERDRRFAMFVAAPMREASDWDPVRAVLVVASILSFYGMLTPVLFQYLILAGVTESYKLVYLRHAQPDAQGRPTGNVLIGEKSVPYVNEIHDPLLLAFNKFVAMHIIFRYFGRLGRAGTWFEGIRLAYGESGLVAIWAHSLWNRRHYRKSFAGMALPSNRQEFTGTPEQFLAAKKRALEVLLALHPQNAGSWRRYCEMNLDLRLPAAVVPSGGIKFDRFLQNPQVIDEMILSPFERFLNEQENYEIPARPAFGAYDRRMRLSQAMNGLASSLNALTGRPKTRTSAVMSQLHNAAAVLGTARANLPGFRDSEAAKVLNENLQAAQALCVMPEELTAERYNQIVQHVNAMTAATVGVTGVEAVKANEYVPPPEPARTRTVRRRPEKNPTLKQLTDYVTAWRFKNEGVLYLENVCVDLRMPAQRILRRIRSLSPKMAPIYLAERFGIYMKEETNRQRFKGERERLIWNKMGRPATPTAKQLKAAKRAVDVYLAERPLLPQNHAGLRSYFRENGIRTFKKEPRSQETVLMRGLLKRFAESCFVQIDQLEGGDYREVNVQLSDRSADMLFFFHAMDVLNKAEGLGYDTAFYIRVRYGLAPRLPAVKDLETIAEFKQALDLNAFPDWMPWKDLNKTMRKALVDDLSSAFHPVKSALWLTDHDFDSVPLPSLLTPEHPFTLRNFALYVEDHEKPKESKQSTPLYIVRKSGAAVVDPEWDHPAKSLQSGAALKKALDQGWLLAIPWRDLSFILIEALVGEVEALLGDIVQAATHVIEKTPIPSLARPDPSTGEPIGPSLRALRAWFQPLTPPHMTTKQFMKQTIAAGAQRERKHLKERAARAA